MTNKCKLCKHRDVCKYKEQYEKEYNYYNENYKELLSPFYIELECNYFRDSNIYTPIINYQPYSTPLNTSNKCGDKLTDEVVCKASGTNNTVGIQHCYDTAWSTINTEGQQILKYSKPSWCDRPYPCAECDRVDYCVNKYNGKENYNEQK